MSGMISGRENQSAREKLPLRQSAHPDHHTQHTETKIRPQRQRPGSWLPDQQ